MAARAAVQALLTDDLQAGQPLGELGFTKVYAAETLDTPPDERFLVVRWGEAQVAFGRRGPQDVVVWAHTRGKDYGPLDEALERVKTLLAEAVHVDGADGWTLTSATWRGDSRDLADDGYGTLTRNTSFDTSSRQNSTNP